MSIGDDALTPLFPRKAEKAFFAAAQAAFGTPTLTGLQALHFTELTMTRTQDAQAAREYGGASVGAAIDPGDPDFGDVTAQANIQTNLCLNEVGFWLSYLLGPPTSTDEGAGKYQHVFTSGGAQLPYATLVEEDREGGRVLDSVALSSLALSLANGGGKQLVDFTSVARDLARETTVNIAAAGASAAPARLFVPKTGWTAAMDGTTIGRVLSASLNYAADIQSDRYVDSGAAIGAAYVGDPTASLGLTLRNVSEAQRAAFDSFEAPKAFELTGVDGSGNSITFELPRAFVPKIFPTADDRLQQLDLTATAARSGTSALTVTLTNTLASY